MGFGPIERGSTPLRATLFCLEYEVRVLLGQLGMYHGYLICQHMSACLTLFPVHLIVWKVNVMKNNPCPESHSLPFCILSSVGLRAPDF